MPTTYQGKRRPTGGHNRPGEFVNSPSSGRENSVRRRRPAKSVDQRETVDRRRGLRKARTAKSVTSIKKTRDELVRDLEDVLRKAAGVKTKEMAHQLAAQIMNLQRWQKADGADAWLTALSLLAEIQPKTATEAMLAVQMIGVHHLATASLVRANVEGQSLEGVKEHALLATRLMRLFIDQLGLRAKLQGMVPSQKVTVEHVHVHPGAQAIVGAVSASKTGPGERKDE